jgi:hypothetical protein
VGRESATEKGEAGRSRWELGGEGRDPAACVEKVMFVNGGGEADDEGE